MDVPQAYRSAESQNHLPVRSQAGEQEMKKIILGVVLVAGCYQERNKSIELMNHGVEMGRQKLYDSAVRDLKQAINVDPTNAAAHFNLGVIFKDMKKWSDSAGEFGEA